MALVFTDFPTGSGSEPCALSEICEHQGYPYVNWKTSNISWLCLINMRYNCSVIFRNKCIPYLVLPPNIFSHGLPLQNLDHKLVKPSQLSEFFDVPSGC